MSTTTTTTSTEPANLFRAVLRDGKLFRQLFADFADVDNMVMQCHSTHVYFQGMDCGNIMLCEIRLDRALFSEYHCPTPTNYYLNTVMLGLVSEICSAEDTVVIRIDDHEKLQFQFERGQRVCPCSIKFVESEWELMQIPETEYATTATFPTKFLQSELNRLKKFNCHAADDALCTIESDKHMIQFRTETTCGTLEPAFRDSSEVDNLPDDAKINITSIEPVSLNFSLGFLTKCLKSKVSPRVSLSLHDDAPLRISYNIVEGSFLRFHLASKRDDDDDD